MDIFKIRNETIIATTQHQGGPVGPPLIWALSEIPPILRFTKNGHFQKDEWYHHCYNSPRGGSCGPPLIMCSLGKLPPVRSFVRPISQCDLRKTRKEVTRKWTENHEKPLIELAFDPCHKKRPQENREFHTILRNSKFDSNFIPNYIFTTVFFFLFRQCQKWYFMNSNLR